MSDKSVSKIGMWMIIGIVCFFGVLYIFFPSLDYDKLIAPVLDQQALIAVCAGTSVITFGLILLFALGNIATEPGRSPSTPWVTGGIEGALQDYYYLIGQGGAYYNLVVNKSPAPDPHPDRAIFQQLARYYIVDADELESCIRNISDEAGWPISDFIRIGDVNDDPDKLIG